MSTTLFPSPAWPSLPVTGSDARYPVHRIFCVGRNYAAHAAEMGSAVDREAPFYFIKSALDTVQSGATVPYPPGTANYHHEIELVLAIGAPAFRISKEDALSAVWGYGAGLDMTRRDLQNGFKDKRHPWDLAKDFEQSAVLGALTPAEAFTPANQRIHLDVNGALKQEGHLGDLIWSIPEIVSHLSQFYHLAPGDLIMTGTPSGVGAVVAGDTLAGGIEGLAPVVLTLGPAE